MPPLPFENALDKTNLPLPEKLALFGPLAIPFILPPGTKGKWDKEKGEPWHEYYRYRKGWRERSRADTLAPGYQHDLYHTPCNVAIPQGSKTHLGAFDFDIINAPDIWEEFFAKNPQFKENALLTIGAKGFTLWILFSGAFSQKWHSIKFGEKGNVEWRTEGNYSVVHGRHPSGVFYQCWIIGSGLVPVKWETLVCPSARWKEWPPLTEPKKEEQRFKTHAPLSEQRLKAWETWIRENYSVLDEGDPNKWQVECPNQGQHGDTREEDTILFTGSDGSTPNFHCSHAHCAEVNKEQSAKIQRAFFGLEKIILYPDTEAFNSEVERLYARMEESGEFFARNRSDPPLLIRWTPALSGPVILTPNTFNCQMGAAHISFGRPKKDGIVSVLPPREIIKQILDHPSRLRLAKRIIDSPILVKTSDGSARLEARTYIPALESIVLGETKDIEELQMELGEAKDILAELTAYWKWVDKIDLARGLAELFTPALLAGGFIERPVPAFLITADQPDAGKTFWHKAVGWIYGEDVDSNVLGGRTSIGGLEELLASALYHGRNFFFVDELDGKVKSPLINALLTGASRKNIRLPFHPMSEVDIEQFIVLLAGVKGFVLEEQFATRIVPVRINKPSGDGFQWNDSSGNLVSSWIKKNRLKFLGAIYAIIKKWVSLGMPVSAPDSRFPSWSVGVNGVLENVLETARVTFELTLCQADLANPIVAWIEEVHEEVPELFYKKGEEALSYSLNQFRRICVQAGLGIPGTDLSIRDQGALEKNQMRNLGAKFKVLARAGGSDAQETSVFRLGKYFLIRYRCGNKENGQPKYRYLFSEHNIIPVNPKEYIEGISEYNE
jgi:hypothetical protein